MAEKYLLSTAYFPPVHYMALVSHSDEILIEKEENNLKQTYRNRCIILSASGPHVLSVPVLLGSFHKTALKDLKIDYSKRWQKIHLRGITSSYKSSAYYLYYSEMIEKVISGNHKFLIDLNNAALETIIRITGLPANVSYTTTFEPVINKDYDFRYLITPKKKILHHSFTFNEYSQVFENKSGFVPGLSILDLIFNAGPDSADHLRGIIKYL
jgi:hypothetical protein